MRANVFRENMDKTLSKVWNYDVIQLYQHWNSAICHYVLVRSELLEIANCFTCLNALTCKHHFYD